MTSPSCRSARALQVPKSSPLAKSVQLFAAAPLGSPPAGSQQAAAGCTGDFSAGLLCRDSPVAHRQDSFVPSARRGCAESEEAQCCCCIALK